MQVFFFFEYEKTLKTFKKVKECINLTPGQVLSHYTDVFFVFFKKKIYIEIWQSSHHKMNNFGSSFSKFLEQNAARCQLLHVFGFFFCRAMIQSRWPFPHHDLDSEILIYHQTEFHLEVVLIHLWLPLCSVIAPRHLHTSLNAPLIVFYDILILFADWFFFLLSLGTLGAVFSLSSSPHLMWGFYFFFFCIAHSMWPCISLHGAHKAAESRGSEGAEGPWCSRDKARELTSAPPATPTPAPWPKYKKRDLFAYAASKHSCSSSLRSRDLD